MKMKKGGIEIDVTANEESFYLRAGYVVVEEPKPKKGKDKEAEELPPEKELAAHVTKAASSKKAGK